MSKSNSIHEQWKVEGIAARYARSENATRPFAEIMVAKSKLADSKSTDDVCVLDVATGTGVVIATMQDALAKEQRDNVKIVAGDISDSMLTWVKERSAKAGWNNVDARKIDGANVDADETFTHIFANFAIFALPPDTIPAIFSLLRPGGFAAISTWAYFGWYNHFARAVALVPDAPPMPSPDAVAERLYSGMPWHNADYMREQLEKAGFERIEVVQEKRRVDCGTPAEYVDVMGMPIQFLSGQWEEGQRAELVEKVRAGLTKVAEEDVEEDGKIYLEMEGIVGWGWKP